jgi:hypothetical protein
VVARDVDREAKRLRAFEVEAWEHFGLAVVAFGLALAASQLRPEFGVPLLIGGVASLALGVRDEERRWALIDRLVLDTDAYRIPIVRRRAQQAATMTSRRAFASSIRILVRSGGGQFEAVAEELDELADQLENPALDLDPACAVVCERLVGDVSERQLRNAAVSVEELRARVVRILGGFGPRA